MAITRIDDTTPVAPLEDLFNNLATETEAEIADQISTAIGSFSVSSSDITDATTTGKSLITSASPGAARTTLGATTLGGQLFTVADKATARTSLGISSGTADPSGGDDGDIYFKIV